MLKWTGMNPIRSRGPELDFIKTMNQTIVTSDNRVSTRMVGFASYL